MPQNVTLYNLLISCPGDVQAEVRIVNEVVAEFNDMFSDTLGITIQTKHWSKNSYPQSGGKPQALLNDQFVKKCDAAVAIFWTRFGSPTDEYGSGTEEEIELMLKSKKQVFMYFSDKPINPSNYDAEGYKKIRAFRERYKDKGIYETFLSEARFKELFRAHLIQYFVSKKPVEEVTSKQHSVLKLLGINESNKLTDSLPVLAFAFNSDKSINLYIDTIKKMYQTVSEMVVEKQVSLPATRTDILPTIDFYQPVEIKDDEKEILSLAAKKLEIELPESFFYLGNLKKSSLSSFVYDGPTLKGTDEEKAKYRLIKKLHVTISEMLEWAPVERAFSGMKCCKLAIQNCGKAVDEDVEITLIVPQSALVTISEFPKFNNEEMDYLLNDCEMSILFGIESTAEYMEYASSRQNKAPHARPMTYGLPGFVPDYSDDFSNELRHVFCYSIYPDGSNYVVKLKIDYIKHNTTVAFPSILFVKEMPYEIAYTITSKNNPDVVRGSLSVVSKD